MSARGEVEGERAGVAAEVELRRTRGIVASGGEERAKVEAREEVWSEREEEGVDGRVMAGVEARRVGPGEVEGEEIDALRLDLTATWAPKSISSASKLISLTSSVICPLAKALLYLLCISALLSLALADPLSPASSRVSNSGRSEPTSEEERERVRRGRREEECERFEVKRDGRRRVISDSSSSERRDEGWSAATGACETSRDYWMESRELFSCASPPSKTYLESPVWFPASCTPLCSSSSSRRGSSICSSRLSIRHGYTEAIGVRLLLRDVMC